MIFYESYKRVENASDTFRKYEQELILPPENINKIKGVKMPIWVRITSAFVPGLISIFRYILKKATPWLLAELGEVVVDIQNKVNEKYELSTTTPKLSDDIIYGVLKEIVDNAVEAYRGSKLNKISGNEPSTSISAK